jgi:hypothetical protein
MKSSENCVLWILSARRIVAPGMAIDCTRYQNWSEFERNAEIAAAPRDRRNGGQRR